ncbi:TPA: ArsR/SmtB family transcription factor [Photobacterium damselae]|uniref:Winged helix-turn-helix transcriptional regulator n=5 Tax=Photobacterium damselae TaxID=38293 RepID=A0A1C3DKF6_PHODD|nr:metalloregulator ArsR/SmtB family transcription factor [Photobacterium damselae]ARR48454.1 transcriptional regulator [Photobacterium damselae subsp. damselae]AWK82726.1 transcriptional regulator [Photobacterium damselae]ELI6447720.1 winged helix-turn-helix transcriptional regulator [Photobacterium damselae]ELV7515238.1 winged helix-turn-helix transcriptional regulator [Photobacterium damselae]KAB1180978.1 winged helix-turn-helix transcriptional regulator [Photobacterium damselae subsp. dams
MDLQQMEQNAAQAVTLLKAMANERRLFILCYLLDGEMSVGIMSEKLGLSQSALSQHLAWLRRDGLVDTRKEAQTVYYFLSSPEVKQMITLLHSMYCGQEQ